MLSQGLGLAVFSLATVFSSSHTVVKSKSVSPCVPLHFPAVPWSLAASEKTVLGSEWVPLTAHPQTHRPWERGWFPSLSLPGSVSASPWLWFLPQASLFCMSGFPLPSHRLHLTVIQCGKGKLPLLCPCLGQHCCLHLSLYPLFFIL